MFTNTDILTRGVWRFTVRNYIHKRDFRVVVITDVVFSWIYLINDVTNKDEPKSNYYTFKPVKLVVQ